MTLIADIIHDIAANPSTEFFYSNLGPNIAARVLEIISKKSFERLMRERITSPLKMRSTNFANQEGGATNPSGWSGVLKVKNPAGATAGYILLYSNP